MQSQADECISNLLILESWTQGSTVNSESSIISDENDRNIPCWRCQNLKCSKDDAVISVNSTFRDKEQIIYPLFLNGSITMCL